MGSLDTVQQEQLRVIGTYLSQIRQDQARSLEEIAAKTYIPLRLLKAIELGQEQPLPEPVFVQGFIRRYADSLGLDGMELAQKFPVHITPLPVMTAPGVDSRPRAAEPSSFNAPPEAQEFSSQSRPQQRAYLPYLAAAALLAVAGIGLAMVRAISSRPANRPDSALVLPKQPTPPRSLISPSAPSPTFLPSSLPSPSVTALPSVTASPSPSATAVLPKKPSPTPEISPDALTDAPVSVEIDLTADAWVQVVVDGTVKAEAVLPKGTRQSWSGKQQITIVSGNAGAVSVAANGGASKKMGGLGDVSELTVKPKP